jgi:hypothetical protein
VVGHISLSIICVDQNGNKINEDEFEEIVEEPYDLINK